MKTVFSLLFIIMFCNSLFSQLKVVEDNSNKMLEVGKIAPIGKTTMVLLKSENDNIYCLDYKDIKFTHLNEWKRFCFINENNDIENLYNMIIDGFDNLPEKDIKLDSNLHYIYLHFEKHLGVINFQFYAEEKSTGIKGVSPYMIKKQVIKLFGKKVNN